MCENLSLDLLHQMQSRLRSRIKKVPGKGAGARGLLEEKDNVDIKVISLYYLYLDIRTSFMHQLGVLTLVPLYHPSEINSFKPI